MNEYMIKYETMLLKAQEYEDEIKSIKKKQENLITDLLTCEKVRRISPEDYSLKFKPLGRILNTELGEKILDEYKIPFFNDDSKKWKYRFFFESQLINFLDECKQNGIELCYGLYTKLYTKLYTSQSGVEKMHHEYFFDVYFNVENTKI